MRRERSEILLLICCHIVVRDPAESPAVKSLLSAGDFDPQPLQRVQQRALLAGNKTTLLYCNFLFAYIYKIYQRRKIWIKKSN